MVNLASVIKKLICRFLLNEVEYLLQAVKIKLLLILQSLCIVILLFFWVLYVKDTLNVKNFNI